MRVWLCGMPIADLDDIVVRVLDVSARDRAISQFGDRFGLAYILGADARQLHELLTEERRKLSREVQTLFDVGHDLRRSGFVDGAGI